MTTALVCAVVQAQGYKGTTAQGYACVRLYFRASTSAQGYNRMNAQVNKLFKTTS